MANVEKANLRVCIALFMLFLPMYGNGAVTPAMASLLAAFPDASVTMVTLISQLPMLFTIVGALLVPIILRKKAYYKQIGVASLLIYGVFGILPFWVHDNIYAILFIRAMYGLGVGFVMPLGAAAFMRLFGDPEQRSKWLGRGGAMSQIGCVLFTLLGGFLCSISWEYTFLAYVLVLVCLVVFVFAFRKDDITDTDVSEEDSADGIASTPGSKGIPAFAWIFLILFCVAEVFYGPAVMMFSSEVAAAGAGGPEIAGTILSLMTVSGAVGSYLFGPLFKFFGKFTGSVAFAITAVGILINCFATSIVMFTIGILVIGFGFMLCFPMIQIETANWVTAAAVTTVSSLLVIATNIGQFLGSYWMGFLAQFNSAVTFAPLVGAIGLIALAVVWALLNMTNKAWKMKKETAE